MRHKKLTIKINAIFQTAGALGFFGKARPEVGQRNNCNKVPST